MSHHTTTPATVELWIRSFAPASAGPTQERALDRLDELEANASVESIEVRVWGKEVEQTPHARRIPQLERIETRLEAFEAWAARTDRRLEPFFRNAHVESAITGERRDVWRLPTLAIAEFDDGGDLLHVAPCQDGEETIDVFDRFDALCEGSDSTRPAGDGRSTDNATPERRSGGLSGVDANRIEPFSPHL